MEDQDKVDMEDTDAQDAWTKPAATFKIKRTVSRGRPSFAPSQPAATSQAVKRPNPFGVGSDSPLGGAARVLGKRPRLEDSLGRRISELRPGQLRDSGDSHDSGLEDSSPPPPTPAGLRAPPLDWSLKSRARLTSTHSFGWTQHLGTAEEASGVTAGVRCLSLARGNHCLDTSLRAQLHAACLYWQHPSLPVPLFPRYSQSSLRSSAAPAPSLSLSPGAPPLPSFSPHPLQLLPPQTCTVLSTPTGCRPSRYLFLSFQKTVPNICFGASPNPLPSRPTSW